jgi:hypothetical protein
MCEHCYVDNGVEVLGEYFGNTSWVDNINLETLEMHDANECVLGQVFGHYGTGLDAMGLAGGEDAFDNGFTPWGSPGVTIDSNDLTNAWKSRIASYQEERGLSFDTGDATPETNDLFVPIETTARIALTDEQIGRLYREASVHGISVEEYLSERFEEVALEAVNEIEV